MIITKEAALSALADIFLALPRGKAALVTPVREFIEHSEAGDRDADEGPLTNSPLNRLIRSAIAQIEAQDLSHWSDAHDKVTLQALREFLSVWGDREPAAIQSSKVGGSQ